LADGADSMGLLMSMSRVYVNEGSGWNTWVRTMALNPFDLRESVARNFTTKEFDLIGEVRRDPNSPWMQTERRMANAITFLGTYDSYPLKHAQEEPRDGRTPRSLSRLSWRMDVGQAP